ncbi:MAG: glycosyltransferase [Candidatus Electrothrix sp. AW3_4]|nr:glycosyltransferase [Candidatus Electrothrix gigas]
MLFYEIIVLFVLFIVVPCIVFLTLETLAAIYLPKEKRLLVNNDRVVDIDIVVLIPAHNEEQGLPSVLQSLCIQVAKENILVVADNCTDGTVEVCKKFGVRVVERNDSINRGKGFALDFGLSVLKENPPDVVIIMDADVFCEPKAIEKISHLAVSSGRPVQACYLMTNEAGADFRSSVSALAFLFKNFIRPLGLSQLKGPCLLTGTGMAFPWTSLQEVSLASSNLTEDIQLGIDLAICGYPPLFCPDAKLTSSLAPTRQSAKVQKTRWEHGQLTALFSQVPYLLGQAIIQLRFDLLLLALEVAVPPLSLLVLLWGSSTLLSVLLAFFSLAPWLYAQLFVGIGIIFFLSVFFAWFKFGRDILSLKQLIIFPMYILWKLPIYFRFFVNKEKHWIRTEREDEHSEL